MSEKLKGVKWSDSLISQIYSLQTLVSTPELNDKIEEIVKMIGSVKGMIYFTGIGKNAHTAARVSDTFQSLGIKSLYIDSVNSLHGGIGIFSSNDVLVAISKSGETEELIKFLNALLNQNFRNIIAVTSNYNSSLAKIAKISLMVPIKNEGDHLGLAPIASTMVYGAILDSIAVEISSGRGYSKLDFVRNHPGGELGKTKV